VLEVNIRGTYNFIQYVLLTHILMTELHRFTSPLSSFAVRELVKTSGQIVVVSSIMAQIRIPFASEYCVSKHALHRLAEFVAIGRFPRRERT
jgi:NAD(P)-dependent dehydrogenase (short-subunit alcohol dehydrogenase family)